MAKAKHTTMYFKTKDSTCYGHTTELLNNGWAKVKILTAAVENEKKRPYPMLTYTQYKKVK